MSKIGQGADADRKGGAAPKKRWIGNALLVAGVVFLCLIAMEIAARWALSDIGTTGGRGSYLSRQWYQQNPPQRNSLGFRERDFSPRPAEGVLRIANVGDSFTFGAGILEKDRISNLLGKALNQRGPGRFEVLNFGVSGANYEEHQQNIRTAIEKSKPQFILLQWYHNDLDDPKDVRPRPAILILIPFMKRPLYVVSALYFLADQAFANMQFRMGLVPVDEYYARFLNPADAISMRADQRFRQALNVARATNIPIAVYLWPDLRKPQGQSPNDVIIGRIMRICREEKVACIDLRPALKPEPDYRRLIVNRFDTHASAYANYLAAALLLQRLGPVWIEMSNRLQASKKAAARDGRQS